MFIVRAIPNIHVLCVDRMQSFIVLKQMVHTVTVNWLKTDFWRT
jgi:hypothetical protein